MTEDEAAETSPDPTPDPTPDPAPDPTPAPDAAPNPSAVPSADPPADAGVGLDPGPPDPTSWSRIADDDFARVVVHVRRALADLDDSALSPPVRRLQSVPVAKLARGRGRRRLLEILSAGGPLWVGLRTRIEQDPELVRALQTAIEPASDDPDDGPGSGGEADRGDDSDALRHRVGALEAARDDLRAQRDDARRERDEARRQRDGAEGREASLRTEVDTLRDEVATLRDDLAVATRALEQSDQQRTDAIAREARRGASRRRDLEDELTTVRRELDELRRTRRRPIERPVTPPTGPAARFGPQRGDRDRPAPPDRVRPGRPSRLPAGVRLDTREGASALVDAVGRLLVDGYNVTRTHRGDLDLAGQRRWLVDGLGALAARRGIDVTVVFDAQAGGRASGRRHRGVQVVFSHPGITADDEIVLAVEATDVDRPIVVVTDDRELRERLAPARVDLLATTALAWLLG